MKESYPDDIMLCFVQGFSDGEHSCKPRELTDGEGPSIPTIPSRLSKKRQQKKLAIQVNNIEQAVQLRRPITADVIEEAVEFRSRGTDLVTGKTLRLSSGEKILQHLPEVKRSLSDRFSVVTDSSGKKPSKGLLTIRKTWSTGNFAAGSGGGGCGVPRSAPSTPLQLDSHPRSKHDKHAVKPLSGSAPSVRANTVSQAASDSAEGSKQPSKARQKKFQRHFPQVGPEERVLNYYSCALVGDLLLQGHLYITKNYFAFYSNVFGYVTKLLIPITSVLRITKEKVARIIPNAVGVCTRDERHVFGSLLSRDATYKLMTHVWKASRVPELAVPQPSQELRASEAELDASEYSPEDDSSSGGGEDRKTAAPPVKREAEAILPTAIHKTGAAVIQPALLTGGASPRRTPGGWQALLLCLVLLLAASAAVMAYRLRYSTHQQEDLLKLSGEELYSELVRWRTRVHGRAASELHAFLSTNLLLLTKVRQSLETLSDVILTDMAAGGAPYNMDVPSDTAFS